MQMSESMNQNSTNCKLDIGCIPPSRDLRSLFDFWLVCSREIRQMLQMKRHNISSVTNTYKKTKDSFRKPLNADNDSTNNYRSMEPELEHVSSSPSCSYRISKWRIIARYTNVYEWDGPVTGRIPVVGKWERSTSTSGRGSLYCCPLVFSLYHYLSHFDFPLMKKVRV